MSDLATRRKVDVDVIQRPDGEWDYRVVLPEHSCIIHGTAPTFRAAMRTILAAVNPRLSLWQRLRRWWREVTR